MNALGKLVSVTLTPDLQREVGAFMTRGDFENRSEGLRALLWRGLYIDQQPRGKWSDSAWISAYQAMKLVVVQSTYRKFIVEGHFERLIKEALDDAMKEAGAKLG